MRLCDLWICSEEEGVQLQPKLQRRWETVKCKNQNRSQAHTEISFIQLCVCGGARVIHAPECHFVDVLFLITILVANYYEIKISI